MSTTQPAASAATTWALDSQHTLVEFSAKHMMITTVKGRFGEVGGTITLDEQNPANSTATVEIGTASIDTRTGQRDDHLRSDDFLSVERYPAITFRSRKLDGAMGAAGDEFQVVGDLTIRDVTREVVLDVTYEGKGQDPWGGERISFSASTKIDRRDFGLTWNQALEAGGVLVANDIKISIEAQAVKQG